MHRVRAGTLDDTSWLRPTRHIWTRSKQPWIAFAEAMRSSRNSLPHRPSRSTSRSNCSRKGRWVFWDERNPKRVVTDRGDTFKEILPVAWD